jgi:hypothetical protein
LSAEKFAIAMRNNGSNSATLDMKLPMMIEGNFEPHFSVKHMLKDVVIATRLARGFGIEFGATDASRHGLTEEMRQGRGDDDYSSLFRQYLPAGGAPSNGEEDQPRFAGLEEVKADEPSEPGEVPVAVETKAEVPSEAKSMGEAVPAPVAAETKTEVPPEAKPVDETVPAAAVEETKTEAPEEVAAHAAPAIAPVAPAPESAEAKPAPEEKPKPETILTFPAPLKEDEGEEPRGLWGGFWRKRTDD